MCAINKCSFQSLSVNADHNQTNGDPGAYLHFTDTEAARMVICITLENCITITFNWPIAIKHCFQCCFATCTVEYGEYYYRITPLLLHYIIVRLSVSFISSAAGLAPHRKKAWEAASRPCGTRLGCCCGPCSTRRR